MTRGLFLWDIPEAEQYQYQAEQYQYTQDADAATVQASDRFPRLTAALARCRALPCDAMTEAERIASDAWGPRVRGPRKPSRLRLAWERRWERGYSLRRVCAGALGGLLVSLLLAAEVAR